MNKYNLFNISPGLLGSLLGCLAMSLGTGCATRVETTQLTPTVPAEAPAHPDPGPTLALSSGWSEVTIKANSAKTRISSGAHLATTRNACGHPAYGGLDLDSWNKIANSLNTILQKEPLRNEYCVSIPDSWPYLVDSSNDSVEVKMAEGTTRTILRLREDREEGVQICSTAQDKKASDELLSATTKIIQIADKEDCPNGWGSDN